MSKESFFSTDEINCNHCGMTPPVSKGYSDTILNANLVRKEFGKPIPVNSWFRCEAYEKIIEGSGKNHPKGTALDINTKNYEPLEIQKLALIFAKYGFIGFGFAETFLHVDRSRWRRGKVGIWLYQ